MSFPFSIGLFSTKEKREKTATFMKMIVKPNINRHFALKDILIQMWRKITNSIPKENNFGCTCIV